MRDHEASRIVLENGLTVLVKEMRHAPVATFWVFYGVGSRNEVPGTTGISHWTEHMMFKGTPTFPGGVLDRAISRVGGQWNAYTSFDFTAYYETMPAGEIDLGFRIEADRMANSIFDPDEVASERTVIISERQGAENSPLFLLSEEVRAAAFRVHPYHHQTIGDMADLETISRDALYAHYRQYYHPANAIAVAVGDLDRERVLGRIGELYGDLAPGPTPPPVHRVEPEQKGERRVHVYGEGETAYLMVAYRAPRATDPEFFPLTVLGSILLGATGMSLLGGGGSNKSSRLYKALVEADLAANVGGATTPMIDPTLYAISATVRTGRTLDEVEAALDAEIEALYDERPITEEELGKAIKRSKAAFAFNSESVTNQGLWLGFSELVTGSYRWFENYIENLERVSLDDVMRVVTRYLSRRQRTVGWYLPENGSADTTPRRPSELV